MNTARHMQSFELPDCTRLFFTFHSDSRFIERGISRENILDAVMLGEIIKSTSERDVYALDRLRVVVQRERQVIVTAWREKKWNGKRMAKVVRQARDRERKQHFPGRNRGIGR